jgi:hypothetical protein
MTGLQSSQVKEIYAHLAPSEHATSLRRASLYGVWVFLTVGEPRVFLPPPSLWVDISYY